ncbi:amino acid racemase [Pontibacillus yanchengensis]|uniref:Amino acid racemase n=1 Tax=Pontibacillus yanchengensis TaxID=462910 RepID=A0ACC7VLM3_9BACI|nr:amino acid racemase [Pontibacillus yanchengensis]MYL54879.1 amino acid racemase [Pontibacillus yanchengensis]
MKKIVGVLGGMGPMATIDLLQKIIIENNAKTDEEQIHMIADFNPHIPSRMKAIMNEGESPLPEITKMIKRLEASGEVDLFIMPCNTAHYWIEDLRSVTSVPILNMIDITAKHLSINKLNTENFLLLSTKGTVNKKLYENSFLRYGLRLLVPTNDEQDIVEECILKVKAGQISVNPFLKKMESIMLKYMEYKGVTSIIGGCTEIPLLFPYLTNKVNKIDPTLLLAKHVVECMSTPNQ